MSDNYKLYQVKMAQRRSPRPDGPLSSQLRELLDVIRDCEKRWALEDWLDRQLG